MYKIRELLIDLRKNNNKYDSNDKNKLIRVLKNVNPEQIYKIYGVGMKHSNSNNLVKNKIERSVGLRYELYNKPRKFNSENLPNLQSKNNNAPRKLSPLLLKK